MSHNQCLMFMMIVSSPNKEDKSLKQGKCFWTNTAFWVLKMYGMSSKIWWCHLLFDQTIIKLKTCENPRKLEIIVLWNNTIIWVFVTQIVLSCVSNIKLSSFISCWCLQRIGDLKAALRAVTRELVCQFNFYLQLFTSFTVRQFQTY